MAKFTKKEIAAYTAHGVQITPDKSRIISPNGVAASALLKEGNGKTGPTVYTFSLLPTNSSFETVYGLMQGSCPFHCEGCYATMGRYRCDNVINSNAINTLLARTELAFLNAAIRAQLDTLPGVDIRIHAAGDFCSLEYANMWREIVKDYPANNFWTYTKYAEYENLFDDLPNGNIVKSIIPGVGFNFGHIDYILNAYTKLVAMGEKPYICRCTFDPDQHCENCKGCIENKFVLFVEHSTEYKAAKDPLFPAACKIVDMQATKKHKSIAAAILALPLPNLPGITWNVWRP